jgi:NADH-quinone oxidoreductase subunit G
MWRVMERMARAKPSTSEIDMLLDVYTLLQACEEAGAEIPRFCYHERLSIAGNCRMCLVEVKGARRSRRLLRAWACAICARTATAAAERVHTNTPMVKKAREGVMEFLLINHPLDCPICDQGGECDLQDQAMAYGVDGSRYQENKRAVEDKYIGPLVKTIMTRCIHCTRCVRFHMTEVGGVEELGLIGRGEDAEITTYLEHADSELQGNVIDLCPVGALTSKPYASMRGRGSCNKTESIDVMDASARPSASTPAARSDAHHAARQRATSTRNGSPTRPASSGTACARQRLDRPYVRMIVLGEGALLHENGDAVLAAAIRLANETGAIADDWAGFGVLHNAAGRVGALDTGFVPGEGGKATADILGGGMETIVLLGADEVDLSKTSAATVIYVGSHGDAGASRADIILPAAAYTEMAATFVNTEGRVQVTSKAVQPKGEAREGWAIFRALSDVMGKTLPYDTVDDRKIWAAVQLRRGPERGRSVGSVPVVCRPLKFVFKDR